MSRSSALRNDRSSRPRQALLVVDDDPLVLSLFVRVLRRDWQVMTASDGATAHELATIERPAIAIVDLRLGGASGLDVVAQLKHDHPSTKIALLPGYITIDTAIAAVRAGADVV